MIITCDNRADVIAAHITSEQAAGRILVFHPISSYNKGEVILIFGKIVDSDLTKNWIPQHSQIVKIKNGQVGVVEFIATTDIEPSYWVVGANLAMWLKANELEPVVLRSELFWFPDDNQD